MSNLKTTIQNLRTSGKTYSEIQKITGASKSTISYYCGEGQKEKSSKRLRSWRKDNSLDTKVQTFRKKKNTRDKIRDFQRRHGSKNNACMIKTFSAKDIITKFGEKPICYLTGDQIDLLQPSSYSLDHYIPATRGGTNTLDNLRVCTSRANKVKSDLLFEELIEICEKILRKNGFTVSKVNLTDFVAQSKPKMAED